MSESQLNDNNFFYPHRPYHGKAQPKNIVFNANLQEFSQKVSYICNLETGGKLNTEEAYQQIKELWKELKSSHQGLELDEESDQSKH